MLPFGIRLSVLFVLAVTLSVAIVEGAQKSKKKGKGKEPAAAAVPVQGNVVTPVPFRERNGKDVFNASGIVALGDSHFVFVDNNTNDALLELRLTPDGKQATPIARLPLRGLAPGTVDDIEDLALAEIDGRKYIFATPSFSMKAGKKGAKDVVRPSALLRIAVADDGTLNTEAMTDFRDWFVKSVPAIAAAATVDPESGGLNVEGLGWDAKQQTLLIGVRTPLVDQLPIIVPVRLKVPAGPWTTSNLEALAPIKLLVDRGPGAQGVRGVATRLDGKGFLVVVANATSKDNAPFAVYAWDGLDGGNVSKFPHAFADRMKAEGLTIGTVGGRQVVVVVDDGGGFGVVWL
ncbi:MAG: hypothetical protein IPF53_18185 [Blastocatellia bacterium]|nr:hypothetical protein [Blastocatellia bacterium]